jgi:hypothetical protein
MSDDQPHWDHVPTPAEQTSWPCYFYPSTTNWDAPAGEGGGRKFTCAEEVPEGWLIHWKMHGTGLHREPRAAVEITMTRRELQAELTKRDIPFTTQEPKIELQKKLDAAIEDEALDETV